MGVDLSKILPRKIVSLEYLRNKVLAVDANAELHQFLALIRKPDGTYFTNKEGFVTSHLMGLAFRSTRLISDYGIKLVFIFDGKPPELKKREIEKRREMKEKAMKEWIEAIKSGDLRKAFSKAVVTGRLSKEMIDSAKKLLDLLGIPHVQAPSEAEAQAAYMSMKGDVYACATKDYDAVLFGAKRIVRYLTISGFEYLPSKDEIRPLKPEIIETEDVLNKLKISREQLIDIAILIGTDFNEGIKGIGPKKALELIKKYKRIEELPISIRSKLEENFEEIRKFFLNPPVTSDYSIEYKEVKEEKLREFLIEEMDFNEERVEKLIERMKNFKSKEKQAELSKWLRF